ncbi:MAG: type II TA system antitoxin MqsA family protein [bacterium]
MNDSRTYCFECDELVQVHQVTREEEYPIKKDVIEVPCVSLVCQKCGASFVTSDIEEANFRNAAAIYRAKHGLLSQEQIRAIREKYNLTTRNFATLLGWSYSSLSQYENGRIQDRSHNDELVLLQRPSNLKQILDEHPELLDFDWARELLNQLAILIAEGRLREEDDAISVIYDDISGVEYSGGRVFGPKKFAQMTQLILAEAGAVFKTKLNKLLFYADFLHFKRHGESITGAVYAALPFGPVPERYSTLFDYLTRRDLIRMELVAFPDGDGDQFSVQDRPPAPEISESERETISAVVSRFSRFNCREIVEHSHKEAAYQRTPPSGYIRYDLANQLSLD